MAEAKENKRGGCECHSWKASQGQETFEYRDSWLLRRKHEGEMERFYFCPFCGEML